MGQGVIITAGMITFRKRTMLSRGAFCIVFGLSTVWATYANGEAVASDHIQDGEEALGRGDVAAALDAFERAHALTPLPALLYNIATCQRELERIPDAVNTFRRYLGEDGSISARDREEVEQILAELRPLHADVVLEVNQAGAAIFVDGQHVATSPLEHALAVVPGEHTFSARTGYTSSRTVTRDVQHDRTETIELNVDRRRDAVEIVYPEAPADSGTLESEETIREPLPWWFWSPLAVSAATTIAVAVTGGLTLSYRNDYVESGQLDIEAYDTGTALGLSTDVLIGVAATTATLALIALVVHLVRERRSRGSDAAQEPLSGLSALFTSTSQAF